MDAEAVFTGMIIDALMEAGMPNGRMAREQALAANVAPWVIDFERRRRPGARLHVEIQGEYAFSTPGGTFTLTAKADRIEALRGRAATSWTSRPACRRAPRKCAPVSPHS